MFSEWVKRNKKQELKNSEIKQQSTFLRVSNFNSNAFHYHKLRVYQNMDFPPNYTPLKV